ncbi:MAG TPA: glycoside hydrolase family 3 N-terminal domain-containing protein [Acidobacteriaceae bacterium]
MADNTLRGQAGRLIVAGLEGTSLSPLDQAWLRLLRPSGIVLFRRHLEQAAQTTALLREAAQLCGGNVLRMLDLEGGLVDRLRDLLAPMPSAAEVAASGLATQARRHGKLIGRAARLLGFNTALAPVLDLALPEALPVMRTRVVSADPYAVSAYATTFLEGLRSEGVIGCGKHFPGLGGGSIDSHTATPQIQRTWAQLWTEDIQPYREVAAHLPMVMISHATYPRVTRDDKPASISPFWVGSVLRRRMQYTGLVVSDDMEMGGILSYMPIEEAAVQAIAVGTDLIEICRDPSLVLRAYEGLLREAERSPSFRLKVRRAAARVEANKALLIDAQLPRNATNVQLERLRNDIHAFTQSLAALPGTHG